jgi:hypothetical protein
MSGNSWGAKHKQALEIAGAAAAGTRNAETVSAAVVSPASAPAANAPAVAHPSDGDTVANRLRELDNLYKEGVITEQEYNAKKQELLKAL